MSVTTAPHIMDVRPNSPRFREALRKAGIILAAADKLNVYSRHSHYQLSPTEVLFEELVAPDELVLYPLSAEEAIRNGLPSCWAFGSDGTVVVQRYASMNLHERGSIDVTSLKFLAQLTEFGEAFANASLHEILEINAAGWLFPGRDGTITSEETDEVKRLQKVTLIETPSEIIDNDWTAAACWNFTRSGEPSVSGVCFETGGDARLHIKDPKKK